MYQLRVVSKGVYDDRGYSNEESLAALRLQKPTELNQMLTYTYGMDDDRFPLTFMTEGQGAQGVKIIDESEWTWKSMGRTKFSDVVTYFDSTIARPGENGAMFEVHFKTHWLIKQFILIAPDGKTQCRIMQDCGQSAYGYKYLLQMPTSDGYVDPELLKAGKYWVMTFPVVSQSYSRGNRSNVMGVGEMKGQLSFHRWSKEIGGNLANKVVDVQFRTKSGGTTNLWINEEMRQFDIQQMISTETKDWISRYNRDADGTIKFLDPDNNLPLPMSAGMEEIATEANYDTYGEILPIRKINRTIGDILSKDTDYGTMEIVLYAGKGGCEDFDAAIKADAQSSGFATPLGDKMINENGTMLSYGKYFNQYKLADGHICTIKHLPFLDNGPIADLDRLNGRLHPRTGYPLSSHKIISIDHSVYNGQRNVVRVKQKGQEYIAKVIPGMSPIPASWGSVPTGVAATDLDASRYEVKTSSGLEVFKTNRMFVLECKL